ncbi:MAG: energy-coupling factor transporter transmembrane component T family protein [Ancrocorticia sp.]|uniref:energy-coupling factor transporter transmembrane component T family protein n=1 Tax=Ancrocorticia sp. TaxID=2593684 RepID=UPI003F8DC62C
MNLFGQFQLGGSPIHRLPVGAKYAMMLGIGLLPFFAQNIWVSGGALACASGLLLVGARLPARIALPVPWALLIMMAGLIAYHCVVTAPMRGVLYFLNVICALYLARLITFTTSINQMMDAIASGARPLKYLGADPEKIALAAALMWRSIPYLLSIFSTVRDSARARGLSGLSPRYLVPAIVQAVGFALATSDALRARGLD